MDDIISKLIWKWFEWRLKSLKSNISKLTKKQQDVIKKSIQNNIEQNIDDLLIVINNDLESMFDIIKYDIEDLIDDNNNEEEEVWCNTSE